MASIADAALIVLSIGALACVLLVGDCYFFGGNLCWMLFGSSPQTKK